MYGLPDDSLVFVPGFDGVSSRLKEPTRIHLSLSEGYYICDGVYATLYEATVPSDNDDGGSELIAFKVFKDGGTETYRLAEEEYSVLRDLNGLNGHVPRIYAFGKAAVSADANGGRPAIAQEYLAGTSILEDSQLSNCDSSSEDHVLDVLQKAWAISLTANELVNNGVRHGDLSYTNVLLTRLESPGSQGQRYFAAAIDFGQAAISRDPSSYGKSGTDFFSPPELLGGSPLFDANRGRASADSYSIGALTLYMLLRPSFSSDEEFFNNVQSGEEHIKEKLEAWLTRCAEPTKLDEALVLVIRCCMCREPADRLATSDVVQALEALCAPERRTPEQLDELIRWLLRRGAAGRYSFERVMEQRYRIRPSGGAIGRDHELDAISARLQTGRVAYLRGLGGIGKTTLSLRFAASAMANTGASGLGIERAYLISAEDGLAEELAVIGSSTLAISEESVRPAGERTWRSAELAVHAMEEGLGSDVLVIIDGLAETPVGYDSADAKLVVRMAQGGAYRLLITSRGTPTGPLGDGELVVGGMDDGSLDHIFREQLRGAPCDLDLLPRLYRAVGRNTLAVKIVGGLIGQSGGMLSLADVLGELESGSLGNGIIDEYQVTPDSKHGTDTIRGHVLKLFSLAGFAQDELRLLSMLLLIPGSGILLSTLREGLRRYDPSLGKAFGSLRSRGWIESIPEEGRVFLHPLVRDVCLESDSVLPPSVTSRKLVEVLYDNARWRLNNGEFSYLADFEAMVSVAEALFDGEIRDSAMARILQLRAEALHMLGRADQEVGVLEKLVVILERMGDEVSDPEEPRTLTVAEALYRLCIAQSDLGRPVDAVESAGRALRLLGWGSGYGTSMVFESANHLAMIASLLSMRGYASHDLWAHGGQDEEELRSALIDKEAALKIVKTIGGDSWQVASILYTLAYTEFCFDDMRDQALVDEEEAILLLRSSGHRPDYERELLLATSLNFMGYFLCGPDGVCDRGRLEESLECKEEAIRIRYRYLEPRHRDIARSHNNIALSLREIGDLESALDHALIALKIREGRLSLGDVGGSLIRRNVAELQDLLSIGGKALEERFERLQIPSSYVR